MRWEKKNTGTRQNDEFKVFCLKNTTKVGERQRKGAGGEPGAPAKVESKLGSNKEIKSEPNGCREER